MTGKWVAMLDAKRLLRLLGRVERRLTAALLLVASLLVIVIQIMIVFFGVDVSWDRQSFIYLIVCGSFAFSILQIFNYFQFRQGFIETCIIAGIAGRMPDSVWMQNSDKHK